MYKVVEKIDSFKTIPWDESIIVTGGIGGSRAWFRRMPGVFRKDNDDFRFVDDFGMPTRFGRNDSVSLNLLEKQVGAGGDYARKPEGSETV